MASSKAGSSRKRGTYRKYTIEDQKAAWEDAARLHDARGLAAGCPLRRKTAALWGAQEPASIAAERGWLTLDPT